MTYFCQHFLWATFYRTGTFDLRRFQQSTLVGNIPLKIEFTPESTSIEDEELRFAVGMD